MSFEAVPENSQRWSWGNVRQTILGAASSHRKRTIANSGQLWGWRRPESGTAAVGIGDALGVVGEIPWRQTMQALVNEHSQLEIDAFRRPQPVKVSSRSIGVTCWYREDRWIVWKLDSHKEIIEARFRTFYPPVKIWGRIDEVSESIFRSVICAPNACFRFSICCSVSEGKIKNRSQKPDFWPL